MRLTRLATAGALAALIIATAIAPIAAQEITMPQSATLKVPGATLYYELWGGGPVLLVIPGGPQDAGVFSELARVLADRYTVVPYDPRGNSRSPFDGEPTELSLDQQADDAAALLLALDRGPAFVFGTSGGAQIGLDLAARHPELVTTLVAHEPPTMMLLDDPSKELAAGDAIYETYKREGVDAAMGLFFGMNALDVETGPTEALPEIDMPPEAAETFARVSGNFEYWLAHGMRPLSRYVPEVNTLKAGKPRIVVGISTQSRGQPIAEMSSALANKLGVTPVAFPGDHVTGFDQHAPEFAEALDRAFAEH